MATSEVIIQGGVTKVSENYYRYDYNSVAGWQTVFFTSALTPRIGDTIVNNVLVRPDVPPINQDKRMWTTPEYESWPDAVQTKPLE